MQKEKITIRRAKMKDIGILLELFDEFMDEHGKIVTKKNESLWPHVEKKKNARDIFRVFVKKNIKSNKSLVNLSEVDGKIAGYCLSFIKDATPVYLLDKVGYISDLYVKKEFRGRGISSLFRSGAFKFFRERGLKYSSIMVQKENIRAHSIYKKWDFFDYKIEMRRRI